MKKEKVSFDLEIWSDSLERRLPARDLPSWAVEIGGEVNEPTFYLDNVGIRIAAGERRLLEAEHFWPLRLLVELVRVGPRFSQRVTLVSIGDAQTCWIFSADGASVALSLGSWSIYEAVTASRDQRVLNEAENGLAALAREGEIYGSVRMDTRSWLEGLRRLGGQAVDLLNFALKQPLKIDEPSDNERLGQFRQSLSTGLRELRTLLETPHVGTEGACWHHEEGEAANGPLGRREQLPDLKLYLREKPDMDWEGR